MSIELIKLQKTYVAKTYEPELAFVKGQGCYVWDSNGMKYLDFTSGIGVCNLGHCHPAVTRAIEAQASRLVHISNLFINENQPLFARVLSEKTLGGRVFFANSGAEANEGMIKFARKWGAPNGKYEILYMNNSFHGRTLATLAATDKPRFREGFGPHIDGFKRVRFNDIDSVKDAVSNKTVAVMLEPVQGEGGVVPAEPSFVQQLRTICDQEKLLLLFDEVQCGMGRTGKYFAFQHYGVTPDAMSMAKALGNGFPIGALAIQEKWGDILTFGTHASTFGGSPLACAAGLAVFDVLKKDKLVSDCQRLGNYLNDKLTNLVSKYNDVVSVRGIGLMRGIEFKTKVAPILKKTTAKGLLLLSAGENVIRLLPPLVVNEEQIDAAITILETVLDES